MTYIHSSFNLSTMARFFDTVIWSNWNNWKNKEKISPRKKKGTHYLKRKNAVTNYCDYFTFNGVLASLSNLLYRFLILSPRTSQFIKRKGPGNNRVKRHVVSGLVPLHMLNQVRWFGVHFESVQRFQTCFFESVEIVLILCFLIASQDILRFHTNYNGTISLSNRSLLKCEATLSGRDIQSEMETQTSCEAQTLALECSQHRPRLYYMYH